MRNFRHVFCIGLFFTVSLTPIFDLLHLQQLSFTTTALASAEQQALPNDTQTSELFLKELETIYLTNLERRQHGLSPLRWNRQLQLAARWFAADAVEGNAPGFCDHTDSQQRSPGQRFLDFGYRHAQAWGENVICGYTEPQYAVAGWMNSAGHRANLLHSDYREIGVGYYQGASGRGYVTQDFSFDVNYAPVVINNEAISTTNALVDLFIYDPAVGEGLEGMGPAVAMMIANEPDFLDATWQPFAQETTWPLDAGEGWRSVYVKTRDAQGRTSTVFDTIYLGERLPVNELDLRQGCGFRPRIDIEALDRSGWPQVQLSLSWLGDNEDSTFQDINQIGQRVNDPNAIGQSAYYIAAGDTAGRVRYWTTTFYKDVPLVAYFRIRATNIATADEVVTISISGGGTTYGPLTLQGTDFTDANSYREFALPFQFNNNSNDPYLTFNIDHSGKSDIYLDTISIFTDSMSLQDEAEWQVLGGYHRSRGIWARFVEPNGTFTEPTDLQVFGTNSHLVVPPAATPPAESRLPVINPSELTHHLFIPITMR